MEKFGALRRAIMCGMDNIISVINSIKDTSNPFEYALMLFTGMGII